MAGPSLRWNVFDYGRISNNVRVQDARLQQLIEAYRDKVRQAAREADDAANGLTRSLQRERILREAELAAQRSLALANTLYREGYSDFQRVLDAQRALLDLQDSYLVSRGDAVSNVIALYKALGGGWYSAQPKVDARHAPADGTTHRLGRPARRADRLIDAASPLPNQVKDHD